MVIRVSTRFTGLAKGCFCLVTVLLCVRLSAKETPEPVLFRIVKGTLLDQEDRPVQGTVVCLFGLDAWMGPAGIVKPHTDYTSETDSGGHFRVRITSRIMSHNSGTFCLVAEPGRIPAVAVSPRLEFRQPVTTDTLQSVSGNIRHSERVEVYSRETSITLRLMKGTRLSGVVKKENGDPVPGASVRICHDLHVGSHTGYGGAIWPRKAVTDAKGAFLLDNVPPVDLYMGLEGIPKDLEWGDTRIGAKKWAGGRIRSVTPAPGESLRLDFKLIPYVPHIIQGKVTDPSGVPLKNVRVQVSIALPQDSWADTHTFEQTTTDVRGNYRFDVGFFRILNFASFQKEGFFPHGINDANWARSENGLPLKKGTNQFDVVLRPFEAARNDSQNR